MTAADRFAAARAVADAVLYEGYVLYPYRASAAKNQLRWQFGVLTPRPFSEADGSERWALRTECLLLAGPQARLAARVRCLQVQHRSVEDAALGPVGRLEVDDRVYVDWDEAVDRAYDVEAIPVSALTNGGHEEPWILEDGRDTEAIFNGAGGVVGRVVRVRRRVQGAVRVEARGVGDGSGLIRVAVTVENLTDCNPAGVRRDAILDRSFVAVHVMLAVEGGTFVSLLDPPGSARGAAAECRNEGCFPVLVGAADDVVLASPIILYDHPEVAAESPGDLYDATEIDEILALRVLTLTDEEKSEARGTDARAAAIVDRCDHMPPEVWERLHGAVRSLEPAGAVPWWDPSVDASVDPGRDGVTVRGIEVKQGSAVRLWPSRRSDAQDLFVRGMNATVAGVFTDVDGRCHVAVTLDDDPATEELAWQGRYLYFDPDEVEPLVDGPGMR